MTKRSVNRCITDNFIQNNNIMNSLNLKRKSKFLLFTLLAILFGGVSPAWADELTENFDDLVVWIDGSPAGSNFGNGLSNGWIMSAANSIYSSKDAAPYGLTTGGVDGTKALWADYGSTNTNSIIIPTLLKGDVKFYAKYTSIKNTKVNIYKVTESAGKYSVTSTLLGSITPTSSFAEYTINIGDDGNYIAINMVRACLDNFSATIFDEGSCKSPKDVAASSMTSSSATLNWTAGDGEQDTWQIVYSTDKNFDKEAASKTTVNTTSYELTGLSANTTYYAAIRAYCSAEEQSGWATVSFKTQKVSTVAEGFTDDFESDMGWELVNGTQTNAWCWGAGTNNGGEKALYISNDGGTTNAYTNSSSTVAYATKFFSFQGGDYTFSYDWKALGESDSYDYLRVVLAPDVTLTAGTLYSGLSASSLPSGWIALDGNTYLSGKSDWQHQSVDAKITAGNYVVIFLWRNDGSSGSNPPAAIDNFSIKVQTTPLPSALAVSDITAHTATLTWATTPNTWEVYCSTNSTAPAADVTVTASNISTNSYTFTGLAANTQYYVWVRSVSGSDKSEWAGADPFTTLPSCVAPTALTVSSSTMTSATLTWTDETEQDTWQLSYSTVNGDPDNGTIVKVNSKSYEITGLTAGTTYYAYVRAYCGENDQSAWSEVCSFVPGVFTVNDGTTTNGYVPVYGYYVDNLTKSQFIIPAASLSAIANKQLDKLVFYSSSASLNWGAAEFEVYMKVVEKETFDNTSLEDWNGMTKVYTGPLSVADNKMVVEFTEPFNYMGGNLMIGFNQIVKGTYKSSNWYGVSSTGSALGGYASSISKQNFLPKTSIYYSALALDPKMEVSESELSFGLVSETVGEKSKTFIIKNKGLADLKNITVSYAGDEAVSVSEVSGRTIAVGGDDIVVTVTVDTEAYGEFNGTITVSATGQDNATISVSGIVIDPEKMFVDFSDKQAPEDWTVTNPSYYSWTFTDGYAKLAASSSYKGMLTTPKLNFKAGEKFYFDACGNYSYGASGNVVVKTSADGETWSEGETFAELANNDWKTYSITIASADVKYVKFEGYYINLDNIYGGEQPKVAKMVVTEPESLSYGIITEATDKTFTIANTGRATLEGIKVTSSNDKFTISGAPASLDAGASKEVTITMAASATGALSSDITISATDMEDVQFTVSGAVLPSDAMVVDFNEGLPEKWSNVGNKWTFNDGVATTQNSSSQLITPKLLFSAGDFIAIKAQCSDNDKSDYIQIVGSNDNGSTWTAYDKKIYGGSGLALMNDGWGTILLTDIPTTVNCLKFVGYYVKMDEIAGLNYAPVLEVYKNGQGYASPATHDFGECATNASVTYNFTNYGGGTISITDVAITGDGAAAYSTNWSESVAVPFDLLISRSYDANRVGASEAVITVTTTEGDFVINVTGSDKGLNAPELTVSFEGEPIATGVVADFGDKLREAPKAKVYTVTNSGTGTLTGTISSDNTDQFTVSAASFSLGSGESMTFEIALVYDDNYGSKSATITVHPTVDGLNDIEIHATASTLDPEAWTEDFDEAASWPTGWVTSGWTLGTNSSYENKTKMALAPSGSSAGTLITPCLTAKKDDVLTWDAYFKWADEPLIVEYSNDEQKTWNSVTTVYGTESGEKGSGTANYHKELTFTAPADGDYYLRFTSTYSNGIDNFNGFKLNLPDHIVAITASSIPSSSSSYPSMKEGVSFNATVTVSENRGVEEAIEAKFYMDDEVIGMANGTVAANGTKQLTIVCTPTKANAEAKMYIEVSYAGGTLTTDEVTRTVAAAVKLTLDENSSDEFEAGSYDVITLDRTYTAPGWNTIVLPFAVSNLSIFGEGAKAYEFTNYEDDILKFNSVSSMNMATPYILYVPAAISEPIVFNNITISSLAIGDENIRTTKNGATFQGTYTPIAAPGMEGKYGVTKEAKIAKGTAKASIKGFRAYFELPDGASSRISLYDETTGITTVFSAEEMNSGHTFNMNGQPVQNMRKGLYIKNGKKVVVK